MSLSSTSDATFDNDVNRSAIPVLVDFWAEWCKHCHTLTPVLEELAIDYSNKIKIIKLNVDECPNSTAKYGVRGIPSLLLFKDGKMIATKSGYQTKSQLTEFLDSNC